MSTQGEGNLHNLKGKKVLFDLKECDELFQKDKSLKQMRDIREIQRQIFEIKQKELNFYKNLRLDKQSKEKIFGIQSMSGNSQKSMFKMGHNQQMAGTATGGHLAESDRFDGDYDDKDRDGGVADENGGSGSTVNGKVIVQDPLQGNLIMTINEYNDIYCRDPLNY